MTVTLDDRDVTWEGVMLGSIPDEFTKLICPGHVKGFTRNPLDIGKKGKDEHVWVCGVCMRPTRIALVNCVGCEVWYFTMRIVDVKSDGHTRTEYFCEECRG